MSRRHRMHAPAPPRHHAQSGQPETEARLNALRSIAAAGAWLRWAAAGLLLRRQRETHRVVALQHAARLASEIVDVARSIEADLPELPRTSQVVALATQ